MALLISDLMLMPEYDEFIEEIKRENYPRRMLLGINVKTFRTIHEDHQDVNVERSIYMDVPLYVRG